MLPRESLVALGPFELTLSRLLLIAGLGALVAAEGARRELLPPAWLALPLALLLAAGLASTLRWGTEPRLRFLVESVALVVLVFGLARTRPATRAAIAAAGLAALALAALPGLAQIAQEQATGFYRDGCRPVTAAPPEIPPGTVTRATGSFANPNLLAGHVLLLAPLAAALAGLALARRGRGGGHGGEEDARRALGLGAALLVALAALALVLTYSRAAVFAGLVAVAVAVALSGARHRLALAALAVAIGVGASLLLSACGSEAGAGYGRGDAWADAIELGRENPLTGVGLGRVGDVLRAGDPRVTTQHAHNLFLNWWAEAGAGALLAWLALYAGLVWHAGRAALRGGDALARAALAALVGFGGVSMLDHPANVDRVATAFWVVAALAAAASAAPIRAGSRDRARTTSTGPSSRAA